jgi:murein DD-endopeptidase MepM/ murein hydrolase activator NlpD
MIDTLNLFPIMGSWLDASNTLHLNLSNTNKELVPSIFGDIHSFSNYINGKLKNSNKQYGIGGYLEDRNIYSLVNNFVQEDSIQRNIHLGMDVWTSPGACVYSPLDGIVHSFQLNKGEGNYGPTIILAHNVDGKIIHSLYGHLATSDIQHLRVGMKISQGALLCHLGESHENGGWPPHLHFQLIYDMQGWIGDYPGVSSKNDLEGHAKNCPDPILFIFKG